MMRIENDCCDCANGSYSCLGFACPRRNAKHFYCDECGSESTLYEYNDKELCQECLLDAVPVVEGSKDMF